MTDIKLSSKKVLHKPLLSPFVGVGFFDGSLKEGRCGSGMVMKLNEHIFNIWMGGDEGSNTRDELLGLWRILFFAKNCGIDSLIIFGDSKDVIEWVKGSFNLEVINLKSWCKRITWFSKSLFSASPSCIFPESTTVKQKTCQNWKLLVFLESFSSKK